MSTALAAACEYLNADMRSHQQAHGSWHCDAGTLAAALEHAGLKVEGLPDDALCERLNCGEDEKRKCFWINPRHHAEGQGYIPAVVTENEPGYQLMSGQGEGAQPWYWGPTIEDAEATAERENMSRWGLTKEDAWKIVASSMAARRRPKVLIEVSGGVADYTTEGDVDVELIDHDNEEIGEP